LCIYYRFARNFNEFPGYKLTLGYLAQAQYYKLCKILNSLRVNKANISLFCCKHNILIFDENAGVKHCPIFNLLRDLIYSIIRKKVNNYLVKFSAIKNHLKIKPFIVLMCEDIYYQIKLSNKYELIGFF